MKYCLLILALIFFSVVNAQEQRLVLPVGHTNAIQSSCFSSDDTKILTASFDHTIKLWDTKTGRLLLDLIGHKNMVMGAVFINNSSKIVSWSYDKTVKVWDAKTGKILNDLEQFEGDVRLVKITNDATKIIVISASLDVRKDHLTIINTDNFKINFNKLETHTIVWDAGISFDKTKLALATSDAIQIWNINTGKLTLEIKGHTDRCTSIAFAPDDDKILTASWDKSVKIWDAKTGNLIHNLIGHNEEVYRACFDKDGKKFYPPLISTLNYGIQKVVNYCIQFMIL
jgi:WD40 repeat protein